MKQHRIAVSCGEGFASGFLAGHLNIFAAQEGISDKVIFIRIPYMDLYEHQHEFDMAIARESSRMKYSTDGSCIILSSGTILTVPSRMIEYPYPFFVMKYSVII